MSTKNINKAKTVFEGTVVGTKMAKTIIVRIDQKKLHHKYKKYFSVSKKYKVHCENPEIKKGDKIEFEECRPISKDKRWRIIEKSKIKNQK